MDYLFDDQPRFETIKEDQLKAIVQYTIGCMQNISCLPEEFAGLFDKIVENG